MRASVDDGQPGSGKPGLTKGPHYTVQNEVRGDGHYLEFNLKSDYGDIEAEGRTVLKTRILEVAALAKLSDVSKTEVFAKAAGGAVLNVGKGVASVVTDPGGTAKGIGGGLKRFGGRSDRHDGCRRAGCRCGKAVSGAADACDVRAHRDRWRSDEPDVGVEGRQ